MRSDHPRLFRYAHTGPKPSFRRPGASARGAAGCVLLMVILSLVEPPNAHAQTVAPAITQPTEDQVLQGQVTITGTTGASNFGSAELAFAYASDPTSTWFAIQALSQPVEGGTLATWDTTKITDGDYVMRLRVFTTDGAFQDATVSFIIANYTAPVIASPTPEATGQPSIQIPTAVLMAPSATSAPTDMPSPTPLPPNPAAIPTGLVYEGLGRGALFAVAAIVALGVILWRRRP